MQWSDWSPCFGRCSVKFQARNCSKGCVGDQNIEIRECSTHENCSGIMYSCSIDDYIQLFQFTLSDQSFKGTGQDRKAVWVDYISFIQMARHRKSSLYGRGIVNFADNYSLRSHIPLRSCLVGLRL